MTTVETKRRSLVLPITVVAVLGILGIFAIHSLTRETVEVRVSPVTRENLLSSISTNGKVEPLQIFQAHAPAPGVVKRVFVDVGQKVRAGDPLLQLDDAEVVSEPRRRTLTISSRVELRKNETASQGTSPAPASARNRPQRISPLCRRFREKARLQPLRSRPPSNVCETPMPLSPGRSSVRPNATARTIAARAPRRSPRQGRRLRPRRSITRNTTFALPTSAPSMPFPSAPMTSSPRAKTF